MHKSDTIEGFVERHPEWEEAIWALKRIIREASPEFDEHIKWGAPVYSVGGKNLIGIAAFKSYVGIWFFQGALLKDKEDKLVNAQPGKTKAMRNWPFNGVEEIEANADLLKQYFLEALELHRQGREILPERKKQKKAPVTPKELSNAFKADPVLQKKFDRLSRYKQLEYIAYIGEAKREATRNSRVEKCIPIIMDGKGLNDKYR